MSRRRGTAGLIGGAAATKLVVMALSGVLGIVTSKLIIGAFGTDVYAQYGLLTSFPSLLPFADLGIAAVIINSVAGATDPRRDPEVRRVLTTAFRVLLASGGAIALVGVAIGVAGLWPVLLGRGLLPGSGPLAATLCTVVFGLLLPLTVSQRVLVGLHRTSTQITSQLVVAPFMLVTIGATVLLAVPAGGYIAILSYLANASVSVICMIVVARALSPQLGDAIRDVPRLRAAPGAAIIGTTWPMLLQMVALPVAMQTDRLLLSHLTEGPELAQYNLASQLFGLVLQTISAAGIVLWPIYAKARAESALASPLAPTLAFAGGGLAVAAALGVLSPFLAGFVSSGRITLDGWIVGGFIAFVAVQAAKYPAGMYMTDKRGLVFQVVPILVMIPVNLGLSWVLIGAVGAGGTVIASAIAVAGCQLVPNLLWVRRDLARRRAELVREPVLVGE